jgi:hypothetical protein
MMPCWQPGCRAQRKPYDRVVRITTAQRKASALCSSADTSCRARSVVASPPATQHVSEVPRCTPPVNAAAQVRPRLQPPVMQYLRCTCSYTLKKEWRRECRKDADQPTQSDERAIRPWRMQYSLDLQQPVPMHSSAAAAACAMADARWACGAARASAARAARAATAAARVAERCTRGPGSRSSRAAARCRPGCSTRGCLAGAAEHANTGALAADKRGRSRRQCDARGRRQPRQATRAAAGRKRAAALTVAGVGV